MAKIDLHTRDAVLRSLHLSDEKVAAITGVKVSTVRRIRLNNPPPADRTPTPSGEPYNPIDTTAETIAASAQLRDAVRLRVDRMARRGRAPMVDWAAMDARMGRSL